MSLSPIERETVLTTNDEEKYWEVYTCQTKIMNKLEKLGIEPYKVVTMDGEIVGKHFRVPMENIKIGKKATRNLTEEQRKAIGERLRAKSN